MAKLHGKEIRVGDKVFDLVFGEGSVVRVVPVQSDDMLSLEVQFRTRSRPLYYDEKGRYGKGLFASLYWEAYRIGPIEDINVEEVKEKLSDWVIYKRENGEYRETHIGKTKKEMERFLAGYIVKKVKGSSRYRLLYKQTV